jgi:hypothetical protein
MYDSIGGITLISLTNGDLDPAGTTVEDITRPGLDGVAYRQLGSRGEVTQLTAIVDCLGSSAADAMLSSLKGLQGTIVSIVMRGLTYNNFLVVNFMPVSRHIVGSPVGGVCSGNWLVTGKFTLRYAGQ